MAARALQRALRMWLVVALSLGMAVPAWAQPEQAASGKPPRLRVRPNRVEFDLSRSPEPYPPPPGYPLPIYVAPTQPATGPAVTLEVEASGGWEIWVQATPDPDRGPFPEGGLFLAPVGAPPPPPGTGQPPWPWMALTPQPKLLTTGQGDAELHYQMRLRLVGSEQAVKDARMDVTFTLISLW